MSRCHSFLQNLRKPTLGDILQDHLYSHHFVSAHSNLRMSYL
nr:MAG TPA: hypothetical protein [Caudoviricetes sp.]